MAFTAAARRSLAYRGLADNLARRLHPAVSHFLTSNSTDDPRKSSPFPPPPAPRSFHFALSPSGTGQTLELLPFGLHHLVGPPRRSFSSSSSRDLDFVDVLTDAAHAAAPAASVPASFPGEVAWAAEDSSPAVAAVQYLIDAVHSSTGLNWWISIALTTLLLRCVLFAMWTISRKQQYVMRQEIGQTIELLKNAKDDKSIEEASCASLSILKRLGLPVLLPLIVTPYTLMTLYIAISNMAEKVPSLKGGGAFWFTDLTTPDALCIFPMITSLFLMLTFEVKYQKVGYRKMNKEREVCRVLSLLSMLFTATLPQAICCSFVTWSFGSLADWTALNQPAVQKLLFGAPFSSSDGKKKPTAEESPSPDKKHEQAPTETRKSSDASVERIRDESDKKSEKGQQSPSELPVFAASDLSYAAIPGLERLHSRGQLAVILLRYVDLVPSGDL